MRVCVAISCARRAGAVDGELARAAAVRAGPFSGGRNHAPATGSAGADREDCAPDSSPAISYAALSWGARPGPAAESRSAVIPRRPAAVDGGPPAAGPSEGTGPVAEPSPGSWGAPGESSLWAALLRWVFALDVFQCPRCGGRRRIVGVHTGGERLRVMLERCQRFLDGRRLGSSRQPVARALPLSPGSHALTITAPGFRPYAAQFDPDPSFPVRVRVALAPE